MRFSTFQKMVGDWLIECFGQKIANDIEERNYRFLEESLELVQARGCTREEAIRLVDYVYGRPPGEDEQEVGGVLVTLAALCCAAGINAEQAGSMELGRILQPATMEKIRQKQADKSLALPRGLGR